MTRLTLFALLLVVLSLVATFFRRLGLGEAALIAAVLALAFCVEIVRFVVKQIWKGYRG